MLWVSFFFVPALLFLPLATSDRNINLCSSAILVRPPSRPQWGVVKRRPLCRSGSSSLTGAPNALWLHRSGAAGSNNILRLCCELSHTTWVEKYYASRNFCRVILWLVLVIYFFMFSKAAQGLVWFLCVFVCVWFWPIARDIHTTHPLYWLPLAHTQSPHLSGSWCHCWSHRPPLSSPVSSSVSAGSYSPVTWAIKCMMDSGACRADRDLLLIQLLCPV